MELPNAKISDYIVGKIICTYPEVLHQDVGNHFLDEK